MKLIHDEDCRKKKGKCKEGENDLGDEKLKLTSQENALATLDIFAGCGGLSAGLQQSGNLFVLIITLFPLFLFSLVKSICQIWRFFCFRCLNDKVGN